MNNPSIEFERNLKRYFSEGRYLELAELYKIYMRGISYPNELGRIHHELSILYLLSEREELAVNHIKLAMSIHTKIGDITSFARDLVQYAVLEKDVVKAKKILRHAVELSTKVRDYDTLIEALSALTLFESSDDIIIKKLDEIYKIAERFSSINGKIMTLYLKARLLYEAGNIIAARKILDEIAKLVGNDENSEEILREIFEEFGVKYGFR